MQRLRHGQPRAAIARKASGWTRAVARRNNDFLMAVDGPALVGDGEPYAVSLTFGRDEIVSPMRLRDVREAFFDRLRRMGLIRLHWLVEFQADGTPHLHMLLYLPGPGQADAIRGHWLDVVGWSVPAQAGSMSSPSTISGGGSNTSESTVSGGFGTISGRCRRAGKSRAGCGASWASGRRGRSNSNATRRHFSGCAVPCDPTVSRRLEGPGRGQAGRCQEGAPVPHVRPELSPRATRGRIAQGDPARRQPVGARGRDDAPGDRAFGTACRHGPTVERARRARRFGGVGGRAPYDSP